MRSPESPPTTPLHAILRSWWLPLVVAAALGVAALHWLRDALPFAVAAACWFVAALVALRRVRSRATRIALLDLALIAAGFGALELGVAWLDDASSSARVYDDRYFDGDDVLGYVPEPGRTSRSRYRCDGETVYDVRYSIGADGLRVAPPAADGSPAVLFFGGSFMFGEGLEDDETIPYRVGVRTQGRYRIHNFAFHGYGPHQMLAAIESGRVAAVVASRPAAVVYLAIAHHVQRVAGKMDFALSGPRYVLTPTGPVRQGRLEDAPPHTGLVVPLLRQSHVLRRLLPEDWTATDEDHALFAAIVRRARDELAAHDPGTVFHLLVWPCPPRFREACAALAASGIAVHDLSAELPQLATEPQRFQLHETDLHPNAAAADLVARFVAEHILGG